MPIMS